jgi:uncharacterized OB-fold protein
MDLPKTVICQRCGAEAEVPPQSIDENAKQGQLRGFDQTWELGYLLMIVCPNCGRVEQRLIVKS